MKIESRIKIEKIVYIIIFIVFLFVAVIISKYGKNKNPALQQHQCEVKTTMIQEIKQSIMDLDFNAVQREFFIADNYLFCNNGHLMHLSVKPVCGECHQQGVE